MPKRTNPFQQLVFLIHRQLASGADVTQSEPLVNSVSGTSREVDIVIRTRIAGHDITVGVECTSTGRPATVEWVEEMVTKHSHLPTHCLVLVSKGGFSAQAITTAKHHNIETLSLDDALAADWSAEIHRLEHVYMGQYQLTLIAAGFLLVDERPAGSMPTINVHTVLYDAGNIPQGALRDLSLVLFHSSYTQEQGAKRSGGGKTVVIFVDGALADGCYMLDDKQVKHGVRAHRIEVEVTVAPDRIPISLSHQSLGAAHVASGAVDIAGKKGVLAIVQEEGRPRSAEILVPVGSAGESYIIQLRQPILPPE